MSQQNADLLSVTAGDLMSRTVMTLDAGLTVAEGLSALGGDHVSGAPVVDGSGRVLGVFSISDVANNAETPNVRLAAERWRAGAEDDEFSPEDSDLEALSGALVQDWMTPDVLSVASGVTLQDLCREFVSGGVHRLLVIDDGKLVGIVSTMDVARHVAGS